MASASTTHMLKVACYAALVLVLLLQRATAATFTIGDSTGWTIPSDTSFYSQWASGQTFTVGDSIVFNFATGSHNVIEVPKSSYDACTATGQLGNTLVTGPATVSLATAGMHYYICGVGSHCSFGQKVAVNVQASGSGSPPTTPSSPAPPTVAGGPAESSPSPTSSPGGGSNSASSFPPSVAGVAATVLATLGVVASSVL